MLDSLHWYLCICLSSPSRLYLFTSAGKDLCQLPQLGVLDRSLGSFCWQARFVIVVCTRVRPLLMLWVWVVGGASGQTLQLGGLCSSRNTGRPYPYLVELLIVFCRSGGSLAELCNYLWLGKVPGYIHWQDGTTGWIPQWEGLWAVLCNHPGCVGSQTVLYNQMVSLCGLCV